MLMPLLLVSCTTSSNDYIEVEDSEYITLNFRTPGVSTRGEVADNECESFMSHIDVVIYEYNGGSYTPFHYERIYVSNTPNGKATIAKTKRDFREMGEYRFYIIANSTLDSSVYYDNGGNIISHNDFR